MHREATSTSHLTQIRQSKNRPAYLEMVIQFAKQTGKFEGVGR